MNVLISRTGLAVRAVVAGIHSRSTAILEESCSTAHQRQSCAHYSNTTAFELKGDDASLRNDRQYAKRHQQEHARSFKKFDTSDSSGHSTDGSTSGSFEVNASTSSSDDRKHQCTSQCKRHYLAVRCGFAKDMLFRASCVNDQDSYGDDACFVARSRLADVVGVADGVGGWRLYGIDPSVFAKSLMKRCEKLVNDGDFEPTKPAQLLASAYSHMKFVRLSQRQASADRLEEAEVFPRRESDISATKLKNAQAAALGDIVIGSSTACVVVLDKANSKLYAANLGDSGFIVVRRGRVVHRSEEQCHYFNAPYQLTLPPPAEESNRSFLSDSPESAQTCSFDVCDGDLILVATDGLYDNMPTDLIEAELHALDASCSEDQLQAACNSIALQARRLSLDERYVSPFARKAREHGFEAIGGKPDDITIVLVAVTREHND